ncbi:hypothetical protein D3C79_1015170 [compost metagenome]
MTELMIILSSSVPKLYLTAKKATKPITSDAVNSEKNFTLVKLFIMTSTKKPSPPAKQAIGKSAHPPLNIIRKHPLARAAAMTCK